MAAPLKTSVELTWLITKVAAGSEEPILWEPSLEERGRGGGREDQDWAKRGE